MSGEDGFSRLKSGGITYPRSHPPNSTLPKANFNGSTNQASSHRTNADDNTSSTTGRPPSSGSVLFSTSQRRHSEQLAADTHRSQSPNGNTQSSTSAYGTNSLTFSISSYRRNSEQLSVGGTSGTRRSQSPNANPQSSNSLYSTNSGVGRVQGASGKSSRSSQDVKPMPQLSSRAKTGPVRMSSQAYYNRDLPSSRTNSRECSWEDVRSGNGPTSLHFEGGGKGRMRDVEDDNVLISMSGSEGVPEMSSEAHSSGAVTLSTGGGEQPSSTSSEVSEERGKDNQSLRRQGSGPYSSEEISRSGEGIIGHPEPSDIEAQSKVLTGEDSVKLLEYQRKLSHTSSGSSFDQLPVSRRRGESSSSSSDWKTRHDEDVTLLTERLSVAEKVAEELRKEKEKLERKLTEAKEIEEQARLATVQVSRLDEELKRERALIKNLHGRSASPVSSAGPSSMFSIEMSQKLESLEKQLAWQVEAKTAVEHDLNSLKQSLVVDGKGDRGKRNEVFTKLQDENSKLKESIRQLEEKLREKETDVKVRLITFAELEQKLEEKEADMKRQNRIQSRFIADLQSKLSQERQQREELRQSAETGVKPSPSETPTPPDTAVLTEALREKDRIIELNVQQLQKLEKTARDVTKIIQHSKHQSETIANLKEDLARAQQLVAENEKALKASTEEMNGMRTHYENTLRLKNSDLTQSSHRVEKLRGEVGELKRQVTELSTAVESGKSAKIALEESLQKSVKECNHWKQKSVQQDMVLQTSRQDVDRLHREVNGLNSTVAAQGKEVERLQRENQALQGEIETHRITAATYKEDFESERKDREAVHTKIADIETQYRHQLEAMAKQLQQKADEAQQHKESLANTEELLQHQQQLMSSQLRQKHEELSAAHGQNKQLQEDILSKSQQVKQYKKQIEQLTSEVAAYKQQAEAHKDQIEFFAQKTEEVGKQRTLNELKDRKILHLEAQCDQLRADNNELRMQMEAQTQSGGMDALRLRPPMLKAQILGGPSHRQQDQIQALPNPHKQGHPGIGHSHGDERLHSRAGGSNTIPRSNLNQNPGIFQQSTAVPRQGGMGGQHNNLPNYHKPHLQRQDSPYSSLPSSGYGAYPPQQQQHRPDGSNPYPPAGEAVDKDSPPSSNIGQPQPAQQRKAHSQVLSMPGSGNVQGNLLPAQPGMPPTQGPRQPLNNPVYHNLPPNPTYVPHAIPPSSGVGQQRYLLGQGSPVTVSGHPNRQAVVVRPPHMHNIPSTSRDNQQPKFSTPVEESRHRSSQKPRLGGYVKPQQASPHPMGGPRVTVDSKLAARPEISSRPAGSSSHHPQQGPVSSAADSGDISRDIDGLIEETASKVRAAEQAVDGEDDDNGIPYDPNLVCPKCRMRFREGEIQKYRKHVSSVHK